MSENHRHHRRENRLGAFLRANLIEIIAAVAIALGIFLILERMHISSTLFRWAGIGVRAGLHFFGHADEAFVDFVSRTTLSNAIGYLLILTALLAVMFRVRWRLARSESLTNLRCPNCGGSIHRTHRRLVDRIISWVVPVRRYRCSNRECRWRGNRVAADKHTQRTAPTES